MSFPWNDKIPRYLSIINEISNSYRIYDVHLHPVEIFLNDLDYQKVPGENGLFTMHGGEFRLLSLEAVQNQPSREEMINFMMRRPQIIPMMLRRVYNHTGPRVFREYFNILGIEKGLLLPVAPEHGNVDPQLSLTHKMFNNNPRFCMAASVPNSIANEHVEMFLRDKIEKYNIIAVKIHPNITAIDMNSVKGKERIECITEASANLELPIIIHGGRSILPNKGICEFAMISNLQDINLNCRSSIILAHGGTYGHSYWELVHEVLPTLKKLIKSNENLFIDVSGLDHDKISLLLSAVQSVRILYGSDGLYENQITILMHFLFALENSRLNLNESILQIMCVNPSKKIFKENCEKSK